MILVNLFFKNSMKMFPSSLAELCTTKTEDECKTVSDMLYNYLTRGSEYFKLVYTTTDPLTNLVSVDERWQSLFKNTTCHRLKKKRLSPNDYATERVLEVKAPFPVKDVFYNNLREETCTQEEYENAGCFVTLLALHCLF